MALKIDISPETMAHILMAAMVVIAVIGVVLMSCNVDLNPMIQAWLK